MKNSDFSPGEEKPKQWRDTDLSEAGDTGNTGT